MLNALEAMGRGVALVPSDVDHVPLTGGIALALVHLALGFGLSVREGLVPLSEQDETPSLVHP